MTNLATVLNRFPHDVQSRIRVVFVTTDPDRDSPEQIRAWLDRFDRRFIGLHGEFDEVNRLQRAFNLPEAVRSDARPDGGYDVGHGAQILAFPRGGGPARLTDLFGTRHADLEHDLPQLRGPRPLRLRSTRIRRVPNSMSPQGVCATSTCWPTRTSGLQVSRLCPSRIFSPIVTTTM